MRDRDSDFSDDAAEQVKADQKVRDQEDVVRKMNGSAFEHREELQLLNEMRNNKASLDFNRAMRDYNEEREGEGAKKN